MINVQKAVLVGLDLPGPEVTPKAKRRIFNAAYKKKIIAEVEAAAGSGNIGEILRREGIYSSTLTNWRKEREAAVGAAFSQTRGPEPKHNPLAGENEKLRHRNRRLEEDLRKAELIIVARLSSNPMKLSGVPGPANARSNSFQQPTGGFLGIARHSR
jgi:transposase